MGLIIIALLVSLIPSLIIYFWFRNSIKDDEEYRKTCTSVLFAGMLSVFPIVLASFIFNVIEVLLLKDRVPLIARDMFHKFIVLAFAEELVKFMTGNKFIKERINITTKFEVIAFLCIAACGFNIIESITYAIGSDVITVLVRGATALHEFYGLIMGYYYAQYLESNNKKALFLAFFIPFFLHGLYDFSLSKELLELSDLLVFLPFIAIILTWIIGIRCLIKTIKGKKDLTYMKKLIDGKENI